MAYDEALAVRIREALSREKAVAEIKMFGGLCFTLRGNMCCGIVGEELMVRMEPGAQEQALKEPHTRPMDFTGRPMKGFLFVGPPGLRGAGLKKWLKRCLARARSLPPKA